MWHDVMVLSQQEERCLHKLIHPISVGHGNANIPAAGMAEHLRIQPDIYIAKLALWLYAVISIPEKTTQCVKRRKRQDVSFSHVTITKKLNKISDFLQQLDHFEMYTVGCECV